MVVRVGAGAVRSSGPHHSGMLSSRLRAHARPHRLRAVEPGRRQGADEDGAARRRSGAHAGAQGAVRLQGRGAGRASTTCPSASARIARAGHATSPSSPPARWCSARWRRRSRWPPRASRPRSSTCAPSCRSTSTPSSTSVAQDPSPAGRRRGLGDVRRRRRDRAGDQRAGLRRTRRAGRPAAHRADLASVRAGAGARHAGRCRADRRRARAT